MFLEKVTIFFSQGKTHVSPWKCSGASVVLCDFTMITLIFSFFWKEISSHRPRLLTSHLLICIHSVCRLFFPTSTTTLSEHCYATYIHIYKYYFIFLGGKGVTGGSLRPKMKNQLSADMDSPIFHSCSTDVVPCTIYLLLCRVLCQPSFLSLYLLKNVRADPLLSSCCATESGTTLLI